MQADTYIENRTFDEIRIGDSASLERLIRIEDVHLFAALSGDINPAHMDEEYAQSTPFGGVIAHGMFAGALVSNVLGMQLPGPGTIYISQELKFRRPVRIGDTLTVTLTCSERNEEKKRLRFDCVLKNQAGELVVKGEAEVMAPTVKVRRPRPHVPAITLDGKPLQPG
ncbi:MaoC/PaaZ C-terminal domain-containing protein [Uliginosibacterium sp. H3]|uniref:MaoC/PaaZ C-terminal domain-containing protein n=1 Tax=Uliginosibacterium silvisoli TaxID=3114758 RepID=A0ABU6K044_9RHOO|nr:MaoC/PaaZ C-terminal domain-containing protein [Uliginosibacterium sp. H3]